MSGTNWSVTVPTALAEGAYSVTAAITNADGYTLADGTINELSITGADTTEPVVTGPSGAAGDTASATDVVDGETAVATLTADETVTWDVAGTDGALFDISATGVLSFLAAPTYVAGGDNTYVVDVTAEDASGNIATQTVTVTVLALDVAEPVVISITGPSVYTDGSVSIPVIVTFDEPVDGFDAGPTAILGNGTRGTITPLNPEDASGFATQWTVAVTPIDDSLPVTLDVADNAVQDEMDNYSSASSPLQQLRVASAVVDAATDAVEKVLSEDLLQTTTLLSRNASNVSRHAADRLRVSRGQACGDEINDLLQSNPIQFATDSFAIDGRNNALLDRISQILSDCGNSGFLIAGHTDSDASDGYNLTLSQNRVNQVRAALVRRAAGLVRAFRSQAMPQRKARH